MRGMKLLLLAAALYLTAASATTAQTWSPVIANRAIYSIAANPQNPNTLFAGNVARIFFRSYDGGLTWEEKSIGDFGGASQLSVFMVHPLDTSLVFAAGLGLDGLVRSTNHGDSWETVLQADLGRFELGGGGALTIDPQSTTTMYAVRHRFGEVYRSNNAGLDWDLLSTIPGLAITDNMRAITVDPDSSNVLLVAGRRAQIYRSQDGGQTWDSTEMDMTLQRDEDVAQFAWSRTAPGTVYATVQRSLHPLLNSAGMYRSTDHGISWERWRFVDTSLYTLMVQPGLDGDEIFIGGNQISFPSDSGYIRGDSIVLYSTDGGATWDDLSTVPWMENEIGDVGANIWGVTEIPLASIPEVRARRMLLATDGGVFQRDIVTSVAEAPFQTTALKAVVLSSPVLTYDPELPVRNIHIRDLQGALVRMQPVTTPGSVDLSDVPRGTYLIELHGMTTTTILVQK